MSKEHVLKHSVFMDKRFVSHCYHALFNFIVVILYQYLHEHLAAKEKHTEKSHSTRC